MSEQSQPHAGNTVYTPPSAEAQIAHMEDVARFSLDSAAMFGSDAEVAQALEGFHAANARVGAYKAHQLEAGSAARKEAEASAQSDRERARQFAISEGGELTAVQLEGVANARKTTKDEVIMTGIKGEETDFYTTKFGQERGQKYIDFYRSLAIESVNRAN